MDNTLNTSHPSKSLEASNSDPNAVQPERDRSPVQSWIRFEDEKSEDSVATIVPTQTIQVDSVLNTSNPLSEKSTLSDSDVVVDPKVIIERSSSPAHSGFSTGRVSPKSVLPPPPAPSRPVRKTTSEMSSNRSSCPPDFERDNGHNIMQNIPLSENAVHQRHTSNHGITQGFILEVVTVFPQLLLFVCTDTIKVNCDLNCIDALKFGGIAPIFMVNGIIHNGDVVVTLLPVNQKCPWVTKAEFKPELVPEELMAQGLTLTVEDYVMTMQVLVNDVRFNLYNVCYKRVLILWIILGFMILLSLLFSGVRGLALFGGGIVWLIVNAVGIFVCMWLKIKLYRMLEQCMASVNALMYKHRILIGLDDRGKISCHKVNLIFVYFDVSYCIKYLKDMLENEEKLTLQEAATSEPKGVQSTIDQTRMDIDTSDIIITGSNTTRVCQKEKYAEKLFVRYSQRWVKEFVRKRLDLRLPLHPDGTLETGPPAPPRHCATARCPCQFIEEHLRFKPNSKCSIRELFS